MKSELIKAIESCIEVRDGFSRVDWEALEEYTAKLGNSHELWVDIARHWCSLLASEVRNDCVQLESDNFLLVSTSEEDENQSMLGFLEKARRRILSTLKGIALDEGFGKHIVLIFADSEDYYRYISDFYDEQEVMTHSAGVYINRGYGHFAMTYLYMDAAEATLGHELTHALVSHLPIPTWINEGLAVGMENLLSHSQYNEMDSSMLIQHQKFWNKSRIEEFYSGKSFSRSDEGQELSYHLGEFAVNTLSKEYDSFVDFVNQASFEDGGYSAAKNVYGNGLDDLVTSLFAGGDEGEVNINKKFQLMNDTVIYISLALVTILMIIFVVIFR